MRPTRAAILIDGHARCKLSFTHLPGSRPRARDELPVGQTGIPERHVAGGKQRFESIGTFSVFKNASQHREGRSICLVHKTEAAAY